ncbi:MAG: HD domain-containing protein [Roseibacillus sp.]|nr:HD domain-containing protein [Roseibacillus sp.]
MDSLTIAELKQGTNETPREAFFPAQIQDRLEKTTRKGDPYLELNLTDATSHFTLKVWSNHPQFSEVNQHPDGTFVRLEGLWIQNQYGIDGERWQMRKLDEGEIEEFLRGDPETCRKQQASWDHIVDTCSSIADPRLQALTRKFLEESGERFRRAAAARRNHHARRGGLVEHVAQMMRTASAICTAYPDLNEDLLLAGVLFHDCGKLWENNYPESGFAQSVSLHGEMMGHIPLGIELVNKLWRNLLDSSAAQAWKSLEPSSDLVRLHLLHLIASHHGTREFGSPTLPCTPEAFALHHIDNLDAKHEMLSMAYEGANELAPGIFSRQFPLPASPVAPLPPFEDPPS